MVKIALESEPAFGTPDHITLMLMRYYTALWRSKPPAANTHTRLNLLCCVFCLLGWCFCLLLGCLVGSVAVGPKCVACGMNNRVWYYSTETRQLINDKE